MTTDEYYLGIAVAVREKANCKGRRVGAVAVKGNRVISTGYNGTPEGVDNCLEGGCHRCNKPDEFQSGTGYDLCICVHAEQNTVLSAARFGIALEGSTVYTTLRPCFNCSKAMLQAKVERVVYIKEWTHPTKEIHEQYEILQRAFPRGVEQVEIEDPRYKWANNIKS